MSHLPPETIFGYEHGLLLPEELQSAHEHIASCERCRQLLADRMGADQMLARLPELVSGQRRATAGWRPYAAAAAILLTTLASLLWVRQRATPLPELAALQLPELLTELADERRQLMGAERDTGGRILSPRATAVLGPLVDFAWEPPAGSHWTYIVRVFHIDGQPVAASAGLTAPRWTSPPLPHGVSYQWQVTATRPGVEPITLPGPSERPPRFRVLDASVVATLPQGDALRRGIAFANAGLLDEALREVRKSAQSDPRSAALLEQLLKAR